MWKSVGTAACVAALIFTAPAGAAEALAIARQGYFFVGGKYTPVGDKQVMTGQAYVEYQIPEKRTQPYPLVIVPGVAQTATNFNGTADGREGWTGLHGGAAGPCALVLPTRLRRTAGLPAASQRAAAFRGAGEI
jgi:hypothetical protein